LKPTDLKILLQEGEGTMLEYKAKPNKDFASVLTAFANTAGGKILLGVDDRGQVVGIDDTNELRGNIQNLARNCDPAIQVRLQTIDKVVVVIVKESDDKPVQCSEGFFLRQGAVTQKLSRQEVYDLFKQSGSIRFDLLVCPKFRYPEDFDLDKFNYWLRKSTITDHSNTEDILVNIEVAERTAGKLLFRNAGVLFFAKEPRRFFNQAYITCLLFKGERKVDVLDRKDFAEGIVEDIESSLRFIERNTRTAYKIEKLQRENIPEYPMEALREAITNAVMHRDWFIDGANVFVEIFSDRIEVTSPGGLPAGMSFDDLGRKSIRRNPLIADLLHRIDFIEKAGTGIRRMREGAVSSGYSEPEFVVNTFFDAVFYPLNIEDRASTEQAPSKHRASTEQDIILLKAAIDEPKTRQELHQVINLKHREHFRKEYLEVLFKAGLLTMTIPDKPNSPKQRYKTTEAGRKAIEDFNEENK
jgi:ATP-dependent DNA helicase RecG